MTDITPLAHQCYLADIERRAAFIRAAARRPAGDTTWPLDRLRRLAAAAVALRHPAAPAAGAQL